MVVGGLALAQSIAQGRAAISAVVAGVVALSYLTPWWLTGWYQHLDRCGTGSSPTMASEPPSPATCEAGQPLPGR